MNSTLILTTNAAIEEYSKRAQAYLYEINKEVEVGPFDLLLDIYYDQKCALEEFLRKTEIARRNPKLNMHISIDNELLDMLVPREG